MIRPTFVLGAFTFSLVTAPTISQEAKTTPANKTGNPLVAALRFSHRYGTLKALRPSNDRQLKATLMTALRDKPPALAWSAVSDVFDKKVFQTLAGDGDKITLEKMELMLKDTTPRSRDDLFPKVRQHADLLTTQFDLIEERHRDAAEELSAWIGKNYDPAKPLAIIVICTGNSRRSMLGSTMGNIAADYYGLPNIQFYSGGTIPSAFNPRAIATLREIGVTVESTGQEAPRGKLDEENPIYKVRYGKGRETIEFSKLYSDAHNPQIGFAAILVCNEADATCPSVRGANVRIPVPYMDPKAYDGAPFEASKYAERRDDIGRFMLNVLMHACRRLELDGKLKSEKVP